MKPFIRKLCHYLLLRCVYIFYNLLSWTWRLEVHVDDSIHKGFKEKKKFLFALWHQDILPVLPNYHFVKPSILLVSSSKDGDILAHFLEKKGLICARGSSRNKSVQSTKALLRMAKHHKANIIFAVDGSKGPRHEVKPGIFALSYLLNYPICFIFAQASCKYTFQKSWDHSYIPMPFSRILISFKLAFPPIAKEAYKDKRLPEQLKNMMLRNNNQFVDK